MANIMLRVIYEFRNLVFEGGGVKGIAYGGALPELERMDILPKIRRVAGTSAGAITAVLLAVGYTADEVAKIIAETDFRQFADDDWGVIRDIRRFVKRYGWHKGKAFEKWIRRLISQRTGKPDLTFKELAKLARRRRTGCRYLYVAGTNLSNQVTEIYSHEKTPEMDVAAAVRISMSIPLYFQAVRRGDDVLVDGGLAYNYPINVFDKKKYLAKASNGQHMPYHARKSDVFNHETLGFRLDSEDEVKYARRGWASVPQRIDGIRDYIKVLIGYYQELANKRHLHKDDWNRTVFIDTLGVKATDFGLPAETIEALMESGKRGVRQHFRWRRSKSGTKLPR